MTPDVAEGSPPTGSAPTAEAPTGSAPTDDGATGAAATGTATVRVGRTSRRRTAFHKLRVASVDELTEDSVQVSFAVPASLRATYDFLPGQHLTIRWVDPTDGGEIRRSYSLCSTPDLLRSRGLLRVGIRAITGGVFSHHATHRLGAGEEIDVLPPLGHFTTTAHPSRARHYVAVVAGSGITPVLSLMTTALATEPRSRVTLLYGNRQASTVMFAEEIADLKDRYPDRLQVIHVLSREPRGSALLSGRIDADRLRAILGSPLVDPGDEWFLCGPYGMVVDAQRVLAERGVADSSIHAELFHVESEPVPARAGTGADRPSDATVTIRLNGRESTFSMAGHERVLDAALRVRSELPYACKGGVCSTCRAKLVRGEVSMAHNYALEPDEIAAGYVLTCQSSPVSDELVVDYDS